jgi:hypothetical protein
VVAGIDESARHLTTNAGSGARDDRDPIALVHVSATDAKATEPTFRASSWIHGARVETPEVRADVVPRPEDRTKVNTRMARAVPDVSTRIDFPSARAIAAK